MSIAGRRLSSKLFCSAMLCAFALSLPDGAFAACVNDPDTAQKAAGFTTNPSSLLEGPNGPRSPDDVVADVQTFVASYPQALPAVLAILKDLTNKGPSTSALQKAIGTGLGKAANVCKTTDLTFSSRFRATLVPRDRLMPTRNTRPSPETIQPEAWRSQAPQPAPRAASAAKRQRRAEHRVPAPPFKLLSRTACPTIRQIISVQA